MLFLGSSFKQIAKVSKNICKLGQSWSLFDKNALFQIKMRFCDKLVQLWGVVDNLFLTINSLPDLLNICINT